MPADPAVPRPFEVRFAYATAAAASLAWVACVMPGARLADPSALDDLATPMHRGAIYLVPALFLLIALPIAAVLARHAMALRGLLAWSSVFVTLYASVAVVAGAPATFGRVVAAALATLCAISLRDALRIGRVGSRDGAADLSPRSADLRVALSLLLLLTPACVLIEGSEERASLLMPFVYVAIGAAGERWSQSLIGLRFATTLGLALVAGHLVVGVRFSLVEGRPPANSWTAWGYASIALAAVVVALVLGWIAGLVSIVRRDLRALSEADDAALDARGNEGADRAGASPRVVAQGSTP